MAHSKWHVTANYFPSINLPIRNTQTHTDNFKRLGLKVPLLIHYYILHWFSNISWCEFCVTFLWWFLEREYMLVQYWPNYNLFQPLGSQSKNAAQSTLSKIENVFFVLKKNPKGELWKLEIILSYLKLLCKKII